MQEDLEPLFKIFYTFVCKKVVVVVEVALVYKSYFFFQNSYFTEIIWNFIIRFSYKHCNFSHVCLLIKMALKTMTRSIVLAQFMPYFS